MKTNKKLTLKQLREELELLKSAKTSKVKPTTAQSTNAHGGIGHDIKNSYINKMYMKSSLMTLWVLSWALALAKRLPMVKGIIAMLSLWYGRTTWWRILGRIFTISRKTFVVINAIIGVYAVFKLSGFQVGLAYSHFGMMGQTYLEILFGFTKRLFEWFLDFLGYDVGPKSSNLPKYKSAWSYWNPNHSNEIFYDRVNPLSKISNVSKDWLPGVNINVNTTPWYKDLTTWLWIGGIISFIGVGYLGYKFLFDPTFIESLPSFRKTGPTPPVDPDNLPGSPGPSEIRLGSIQSTRGKGKEILDATIATDAPSVSEIVTIGVKQVSQKIVMGSKMLNPFYWMTSNEDWLSAEQEFRHQQNDSTRANKRYFPYTPDYPYDPWYTRLRMRFWGETEAEYLFRRDQRLGVVDRGFSAITGSSIVTAPTTPSLGIKVNNFPGSPFLDGVRSLAASGEVQDKIGSIPTTPSHIPSTLPIESPGWKEHVSAVPTITNNPTLPSPKYEGQPAEWATLNKGEHYSPDVQVIPLVEASSSTPPIVTIDNSVPVAEPILDHQSPPTLSEDVEASSKNIES